MIYLYGLFEGARADLEQALHGCPGLEGALDISTVGPWFLVHSDHESAEILPKRRLMLAHTKVLERMITQGTVLPARFGLVADSIVSAQGFISEQSNLVASEFHRLRGHVELGIRISFDRETALAATLASDLKLQMQRDALAQRGAETQYAMVDFGGHLADILDRRRADAQKVMLSALKPLTTSYVLRAPEEDTEVLRAELLVPATSQDTLVQTIEKTAATLDFAPRSEPRITIIGPAPMYNFVQLNLGPSVQGKVA